MKKVLLGIAKYVFLIFTAILSFILMNGENPLLYSFFLSFAATIWLVLFVRYFKPNFQPKKLWTKILFYSGTIIGIIFYALLTLVVGLFILFSIDENFSKEDINKEVYELVELKDYDKNLSNNVIENSLAMINSDYEVCSKEKCFDLSKVNTFTDISDRYDKLILEITKKHKVVDFKIFSRESNSTCYRIFIPGKPDFELNKYIRKK